MQSAIDYMEDHLLEPLNIESIARKAGYSAFHFMRMFNIDSFDYYMAATYTGEIPEGMETLNIPKQTWTAFESAGPIPDAIQDVWKRIFSEWFPTSGYEHAEGPEIEVYETGDMNKPDYKSYV